MDKIKRKSQKNKKVNVSSKNQDGLFMLFFELENTKIKFCIGCNNLTFFDSPKIISEKIISIFRAINQNFVYCFESDIEREFKKMEKKDD